MVQSERMHKWFINGLILALIRIKFLLLSIPSKYFIYSLRFQLMKYTLFFLKSSVINLFVGVISF